MEGGEAFEGAGDVGDPGRGVAPPVVGDEVEHGGAGLGLDLEGLEAGESPAEAVGGGGVAEGDGHALPGGAVDAAPLAAHQRGGRSVPGVVHVPHHQAQRHIRYPQAACCSR